MPPFQLPPLFQRNHNEHKSQGNLSQATSRILTTTINLGSAFQKYPMVHIHDSLLGIYVQLPCQDVNVLRGTYIDT